MGEHFEALCIRVPKVYDWVRRQVVFPQIFTNDASLFDEEALEDLGHDVEVEVILTDGEIVILHEVKLSSSGFYKIRLIDLGGHHKYSDVESSGIRWKIHQTFYLCAPEGTEPVVHLDSFEGTDGSIRLSDIHLQQLSFDLVLGLSVQIEKDVKIEVEGSFCYPP